MSLETKLLSKIIIERSFYVLNKFNITETDFTIGKDVYLFIKQFVNEYGQTPEYDAVLTKFKNFDLQDEVFDTFPYLCKALKKKNAKSKIFNVLQNQAGQKFKDEDIDQFIQWLDDEVQAVKMVSTASAEAGTNYAANGAERKKRYQETKQKGSGIFIKTPWESLNKLLDGGFELSDYVLLQAFSNVGKTWIASYMGVYTWKHERKGVIHYSPEMSKTQTENRLDTLLGHFNNVQLRNGDLIDEARYFEFLDGFMDDEVPYLVKTMEDLPNGLTLQQIEADLQMNPNVKMVVLDGFNLMDHGKGDRTAMTRTSRKLRQLFAKYDVVGLVVHQVSASSEKEKAKDKNLDKTIPNPGGLLSFSETSAVIQDAAHVLSFDCVNGYGQILLAKTRSTGKEKTLDLNCNYNAGYILETSPVDFF